MPRYDDLGTIVQVGDDLQVVEISGGWGSTLPRRLSALCVFDGALHAAFCDPREVTVGDDLSLTFRGPYVWRWDGAVWTQLGGEIGANFDWLGGNIGVANPVGRSVGDVGLTRDVRLLSDGVDLFCAYTGIEVLASPLAGTSEPGGTTYTPYSSFVKKWNGASWDLYGHVPAVSFNNEKSGLFTPSWHGHFWGFDAIALPEEPGNVYVTVADVGVVGALAPIPGTKAITGRFIVVKFDGSDTVGVATDVLAPTSGDLSTPTGRRPRLWGNLGYPTISYSNVAVTTRWMVDVRDMSTIQTWGVVATSGDGPKGVGHSGGDVPGAAKVWYLASASDSVRQLDPDDGVQPIDNDADLLSRPALAGTDFAEDGARNVWFVGTPDQPTTASRGELFQYHRGCRAWTKVTSTSFPFGFPGDNGPLDYTDVFPTNDEYRQPILVWGDDVYVATSFTTAPGQPTRVYRVPILRDALSCFVPQIYRRR